MRADRVFEDAREERSKAPGRVAVRAPEVVSRVLGPAGVLGLASGGSNAGGAGLGGGGRAPGRGAGVAAPGPDEVRPEDTQGPPGAPGPLLPAPRKRAVAPKPPVPRRAGKK